MVVEPLWYIDVQRRPRMIVMQLGFLVCGDPWRHADTVILEDDDFMAWSAEYTDTPATDEHARQLTAAFDPADLNERTSFLDHARLS